MRVRPLKLEKKRAKLRVPELNVEVEIEREGDAYRLYYNNVLKSTASGLFDEWCTSVDELNIKLCLNTKDLEVVK